MSILYIAIPLPVTLVGGTDADPATLVKVTAYSPSVSSVNSVIVREKIANLSPSWNVSHPLISCTEKYKHKLCKNITSCQKKGDVVTYSDSRGWDITSVPSPYWSGTGISRDIDSENDRRVILLDEGEPKTWVSWLLK